MDSEQSSELFDSESKKLQDTLESIQKKSDKTIPEIIDVYYQAYLLYTSPSPRDKRQSRMPSSA